MRIAARALGVLALSFTLGRLPVPTSAAAAIDIRETDERAWMAEVGGRIAARHGVAADALHFSPDRRRVAFVKTTLPPKPRRGPPRPPVHRLIVVSVEGKLQAAFRPITARGSREAPKGLDFLGNDRLVYELETAPPEAASPPTMAVRARRAGPVAKKTRVATPPPIAPSRRLFVIQPLKRRARPVRCEGNGFTFTTLRHRLAYVGGEPDARAIFVDGRRVYPRRGTTSIASDPAWSPDGLALAFLEAPPDGPPRLVLIADVENASGDTVWDLAPSLDRQDLRVFWAGADRMLVGKTMSAPVFSASFEVERPVTK